MQKQKKPLPKRERIIRIDSPQEKATKARQENDRNRTIASYYFNEDPSIGNLVKGAYYWAKGNLLGDSEDPEDYKYITIDDIAYELRDGRNGIGGIGANGKMHIS